MRHSCSSRRLGATGDPRPIGLHPLGIDLFDDVAMAINLGMTVGNIATRYWDAKILMTIFISFTDSIKL